MLRRLLKGRAQRSAARAYAKRLKPQLARDYGASQRYTAPQIRAAAIHAKLALSHLALGYAGFMTEPEFDAEKRPGDLSFNEVRDLLDRYKRSIVVSAFEPASENSEALSGAGSGF